MPSSRRLLYTTSTTAIFLLLFTLTIILTSNPLPTLTHHLQHHICPTNPPPITRKFHPLSTTPTSSPNTTWTSLLPPNGGTLKVHTPNNTITSYGISMFHQLHCLTVLRGLIFPETSQHHSPSHSGDDHEDRVHWAHCFDYIAQGIICAADDTIEVPHLALNKDGKRVWIIDGMGQTHRCRDSGVLWGVVSGSEERPVDGEKVKGSVGESEGTT
ncbi:hypothetical protein BO94DRAFT_564929 [Aspergillus sclerotioniger CBS 115572]|uniref:Uncharacterized protein n=1 Tax=Aspergillus sclerotioniger CBS 115572 TaxID=1450535 RepID=A0A317WYZ5_9EURO|nr:hypothetical protein BO94DRAFT_564929 [Aspergillus sclerotioniger CBS 115572]PWY91614.1 hypothetical protein BO94DRAFT_564929 [Aspergillus sclerotioniger CBS 115572]